MVNPPEPFPDLDWSPERARALGDSALEMYEEWLRRLPDLPVDRGRNAAEVSEAVHLDVPAEGMRDEELLEYLRKLVFDYSMYPGHPGFLAYIVGGGTVPGAIADLVAAGINQNLGGWRLSPGATEIELHLVRFFTERFGLPQEAGGLLVSGGSIANFVGLKAARDAKGGVGLRTGGLTGVTQLVAYTSSEVHFATTRAADMLGIGTDYVRLIEVDDRYRMDVDALANRIEEDVEAGLQPFCVIASLGTVATGAIDPLEPIADICERHSLWMHVDAAYGGPIVLSDELRGLAAGIERADSIAFDPHKWLYTPQSGGCILVRDVAHLAESFSYQAGYIYENKELTGRGVDLSWLGPQLSRSFWALKVWVSLLSHGADTYGRRIAHDVALTRYLAERIEASDRFEIAAPVGLSICCFRYVPPDLSDGEGREEYLDLLNERIMAAVQMDGRVYYSNAILGDRFVLRTCIVNFRTEAVHLDQVLEVTEELGAKLDAELRPSRLRG
ncbi:MAG TPA: aspartate aminotransferase family protein [Actinomycetota bacterium]|nr:aspartate aminotransferase family protein [Actinomycetota bacterium]